MAVARKNDILLANIAKINDQTVSSGGAYNPVTDTGTYTETVPTSGMLKTGGLTYNTTSASSLDNWPRFGYGAETVKNISCDKDAVFQRVAEDTNGQTFTKFSYGVRMAFGINSSGNLYEIGDSSSYVEGSATNTYTQVTGVTGASDTGWTDVACAYDFALGINSGKLFFIGNNGYGMAGNGTTTSSYGAWTQSGTDTDWTKVHCGRFHSIAIKGASNEVYCAGRNANYRTGIGTTSGNSTSWVEPTTTNYTNSGVTFVQASYDGSLFIASGKAYVFGDEDSNERFGLNSSSDVTIPTQTGSVGGVLQTDWANGSVGNYNMLLINTSGELFFAGEASYGHRLDGTTTDAKSGNFEQCGTDTNWEYVKHDGSFTSPLNFNCYYAKSGRLYMAGFHRYGRMSDSTNNSIISSITDSGSDIFGTDLANSAQWDVYFVWGGYAKPVVIANI